MYTRHDYLRYWADQLAANHISRRTFIRKVAILGLSTPLLTAILTACASDRRRDDDDEVAAADPDDTADDAPDEDEDEEPRIVVASWGGAYGEAQREAQFQPFTEETGIEVQLSPQQPEISLLETQVQTGNVEWDLSNNSHIGAYTLAGMDMLETIDYASMDQDIINAVDPHVRGDHSIGIYYWSSLLGYSLQFFDEGDHPSNWEEFWDVDTYPGPRGLTTMDFEPPPLEIPLMTNGIAPEDLYPIDIEQAFGFLTDFREHVTTWTGYAADGSQLLVQGELAAVPAGNGALTNAIEDGAPIGMVWDQGLLHYDAWVIPRGAPRQRNAHRFIEFCCRPETQARFVELYPIGAVVQEAYDLLSDEIAALSVGSPDNLERQVASNVEWWTETDESGETNLEKVYNRWATWILE